MATISLSYTADAIGQIIISVDGISFSVQTPLVGDDGWLINDQGVLLVVG